VLSCLMDNPRFGSWWRTSGNGRSAFRCLSSLSCLFRRMRCLLPSWLCNGPWWASTVEYTSVPMQMGHGSHHTSWTGFVVNCMMPMRMKNLQIRLKNCCTWTHAHSCMWKTCPACRECTHRLCGHYTPSLCLDANLSCLYGVSSLSICTGSM
jgi:hypothetical protein